MEKFLDVNGFKIAYTDVGPAEGRVVFCVHGLLSNGHDYDALGATLAEQGYRVIAMDLPGRGKSDCFKETSQYVLPSYLPFCLALVQHVTGGKGFDWLGVSLGGLVGMALANVKEIKMERFILVDIGAEVPGSALDTVAAYAKALSVYKTKEEAIAFLKTRCASWGIREEKTWEHLIAHNIVERGGMWCLHYDPAIGSALAAKNQTVSLWPLWQAIKQPVLLIRGGKSAILPKAVAEQMVKRYKGVEMNVLTFEECGHVPNLMEDAQIEKLTEWLKKPIAVKRSWLGRMKQRFGL